MTIFNHTKPALGKLGGLGVVLLVFCTQVSGDTLEFDNGDTLVGSLQAFQPEKVVFKSTVATTPLQIKPGSVRKMIFSDKEQPGNELLHAESLTLANNDVLPCRVVSMDEKQLHISTRYAGNFSILRSNVRSLQFGISREEIIFTGNQEPSKWTQKNGEWDFQNPATYQGSGSLAQEIPLPENARFQFNFSWRGTPNFAFRFCAENDSARTMQSTYELIFNAAGMQIRRHLDKSQQGHLADIPTMNPFQLKNESIDIELRVSREQNLISLYIDSKLIGDWHDPHPPTGSYIIFDNRSKEKTDCIISNILVTTLNEDITPRHREDAMQASTDVLIDSEGEKHSGHLQSIDSPEPGKRTITLDVKYTAEPLRVPDRRVSTLLFAKPGNATSFPEAAFTAVLADGGNLQLDSPRLVDGRLAIIHPILGPCSLSLGFISHISRGEQPSHQNQPTSP